MIPEDARLMIEKEGHWALCLELRQYAPEDPEMEHGYHLQDAYAFRMDAWDFHDHGDRMMLLGEVRNFVKTAIYQMVGDVWGIIKKDATRVEDEA